ncbi:checkpoint protein HUS1 [Condylostylus longicornis]|uniref:checkpoint protein HUS1 n=1 Tax=Condylostylus longicornis TaxID=2530218 RepID=UPI00244DA6AE|nr:checkpoint protein HUS1 [Condylostylus longicornis]
MLFRAVIKESHIMKEFYNTIVTLSKLTKQCVMIISSDKVNFIINEETTSVAPLIWTEIQCVAYFDEYKMDGLDAKNNQIFLSFNPANLSRALQLLRGNPAVCKIKLSNKQFPCLTIEIELPSPNNIQNRHIVHDVPITLIPRDEWSSYNIPQTQKPNICLGLPSIRFIRNLVDKLKNLSPSITFYGTNEGELSVVIESDSLTLCSRYRNLDVKSTNRDNMEVDDHHNVEVGIPANKKNVQNINSGRLKTKPNYFESSCLVDCKKTSMFLTALQVTNAELSFSIIKDHLIQMDIEIGWGLFIHCIVPAICC